MNCGKIFFVVDLPKDFWGDLILEIKKISDGSKLTVALVGRLDAVTAIQFDKDLSKSLDGVKDLVIDLAELDYIASAGLRILLKMQKRMNNQGNMYIKNVKREVREVLDMTGFSRLLSMEEEPNKKKLVIGF